MQIPKFLLNAQKASIVNAPHILTGTAVLGVVVTSYLTARATVKAVRHIDCLPDFNEVPTKRERITHDAKAVWKYYIPPVASGIATVTCVVTADIQNTKRHGAAVAAYTLTEKALRDYRSAVANEVGEDKEREIRGSVSPDVVFVGTGKVLCLDETSGRYFMSSKAELERARNSTNASVLSELYVTLSEFYAELGLAPTTLSDKLGWDSDRLLELEFHGALSPEGEPCVGFNFNYLKPL